MYALPYPDRFLGPMSHVRCARPLPQATKWLTPGFLQPAVQWVENTALWWGMPPVRLAAGALYGSISFVDNMVRTVCCMCVRAGVRATCATVCGTNTLHVCPTCATHRPPRPHVPSSARSGPG